MTLLDWVARRRWFRSKARTVLSGAIVDRVELDGCELVAFRVEFAEGPSETYALTLRGAEEALTQISSGLARLIERSGEIGSLRAHRGPGFEAAFNAGIPEPRALASEQSNSGVIFGDRALLKVYRQLVEGTNPELEILQALATRDVAVPRLMGTIDWRGCALGLMQAYVPNRGDAWSVTLASTDEARDVTFARILGAKTAQLHRALADAFGVDVGLPAVDKVRAHARSVVASLDDPRLTSRANELEERIAACSRRTMPIIRVHGDYHLGQVLVGLDGAPVILDFEGEPTRTLDERRAKASPFKDVAGMLRSFAYASATRKSGPGWTDRLSTAFLEAWRVGVAGSAFAPRDDAEVDALLRLFLLEKACYEIDYERNNRPSWVSIPVSGVLGLLDEAAR